MGFLSECSERFLGTKGECMKEILLRVSISLGSKRDVGM